MPFRRLITCLLSVVFAGLVTTAYAEPEIKGSPSELRNFIHPTPAQVSLHGQAKHTAYADKAVVNLQLQSEAKTLESALTANNQLRAQVTEQMRKAGLATSEINTSKFSTSPQYGWFGKKPASFTVVNRMTLGISTEEQFKALAQLVDRTENISINHTNYEHTAKLATEKSLKQAALDDVMAQAKFYGDKLGVALVAINFRESSFEPQPLMLGQMEKVRVTASKLQSDSSEPTPQTFNEVEYQADVWVDFAIAPLKSK